MFQYSAWSGIATSSFDDSNFLPSELHDDIEKLIKKFMRVSFFFFLSFFLSVNDIIGYTGC
jgi:hypothetical protein